MLMEHDQGRAYVRAMEEAAKAALAGTPGQDVAIALNAVSYLELLREHIRQGGRHPLPPGGAAHPGRDAGRDHRRVRGRRGTDPGGFRGEVRNGRGTVRGGSAGAGCLGIAGRKCTQTPSLTRP